MVGAAVVRGTETMIAATEQARAILCPVGEINYLSGAGKGVILIKLRKGPEGADRVLGFVASTGDRDLLTVETSRGALQTISTAKYEVTARGGRGRELLQRGQFVRVVPQAVEAPSAPDADGNLVACHLIHHDQVILIHSDNNESALEMASDES